MSDGEISLYFGLREGEKADLEVVAEAALHWVAAVRAAARAIDPDARIRIELIDADESSLRLNAILEWLETGLARIEDGSGRYPRLRKLAIAFALFVAVQAAERGMDFLSEIPVASLSEEDRRLLNELLNQARRVPEVEHEAQKFFSTIERDPSISGVGVAEGRADHPMILVPGKEFAERSGLWAIEEDLQERTNYYVLDVTLISPILLRQPRSWKFKPDGLPEFSAVMKDMRFLAALEENHVHESLRTGIRMKIRLEVKEKKVEGDWVVKRQGRSVIEVISPAASGLTRDPE